jgi:hypothetical protein
MLNAIIFVLFGMWLLGEILSGGIWKIIGFLLIVAFHIFAVVCILAALVATVAALIAWNRPRLVLGKVVTPEMARPFVYAGLRSTACTAVFAVLYHLLIAPQTFNWFVYTLLFSYALPGFIEDAKAWFEEKTRPPEPEAEREMIDITPKQKPAPPPFKFASWDDEAGR